MIQAKTCCYIDGSSCPSPSGEYFATYNPATSDKISEVCIADKAQVDKAVASAKAAQSQWAKKSFKERGEVLKRASQILRQSNDDIAKVETIDTGKPISESLTVDIQSGADCLDYYAGIGRGIHGEHFPLGTGSFAYTLRQPLGVCAGIGAWNYPLQIACWKSAPALLCGNAMIFKPSELTPLTANILAQIYSKAGLPDGLFNVVHGGLNTGRLLSLHEGINKISLTGEVGTGKAVMKDAAGTLKHVTMELGGKSPLIIFEDANFDDAINASMMANFFTQGEVCSNGTRVFVHQKLKTRFIEEIKTRCESLIVGDPFDQKTQVGSLISKEHMERVLHYVQLGIDEGAKLICGGTRFTKHGCERGAFVKPAVFVDCQDQMTIAKEEIFGPVMSIFTFDDEDEVISRANKTHYGLAAGVITQNLKRAHKVASLLEAGVVWVNNYNLTPIEIPFGGFKQSGIGRENSLCTIDHYTQRKTVYIEMNNVESSF